MSCIACIIGRSSPKLALNYPHNCGATGPSSNASPGIAALPSSIGTNSVPATITQTRTVTTVTETTQVGGGFATPTFPQVQTLPPVQALPEVQAPPRVVDVTDVKEPAAAPRKPIHAVDQFVPRATGAEDGGTLRNTVDNMFHVINSLADDNAALSAQVDKLAHQVDTLNDHVAVMSRQMGEMTKLLLQLLGEKKEKKSGKQHQSSSTKNASVPTITSAAPADTAPLPCKCAAQGNCSGPVKQIRPKPKGSVDPKLPISATNPAVQAPSFGICAAHDKHSTPKQ